MNTAFDAWLACQFAEGLVDMKFAVLRGKGVSVEAVQNEVMTCETAIDSGLLKSAPRATSMVPKSVAEFVTSLT